MLNLRDRLSIPEGRPTSILPEQGEFIVEFLRARNISRTLETGFAYGVSAAYILSATDAPHIAIDPYEERFGNLGLKNIAQLGLEHRLQFMRLPSHVALPQLLTLGVSIDFAFIDGGHLFDEIFIDWYYIGLLLTQGGHVMFDDTWLKSTRMVTSFIRHDRKDYKELAAPARNLCLFQKIGTDDRAWTHFEDFGPDEPVERASGR